MAFQKGKPKTGGRTKGTPNKATPLFAVCEEVELDVFKEMVLIAKRQSDDVIQFGMLRDIAPYLHARKKAIEVDANINMDLAQEAESYMDLSAKEQIKLMEAEIKRLKGE